LVAERTGELVATNRTLSQEIIERRQAETEARRSQALLKATFDASPVAIVIRDTELKILFWSRAAERIFGYTAEEVVGKRDPLIQPTFRDEQFAEWRQRAMAGEITTGIQNERRHKDGRVVRIRRTLAPIHIAGKMIGFVGLMEDVTERDAMERQLVQAQKMEAVGNLTGGLAHDFNNLLGIIVGNLDLLLPMLAPNAQAGEIARDALDAALHGADLTRRLLAFARRQPLQPQAIDLNQLVANAARLLQRMLDANIEISLDLAPETWPVVADPAQLETSVINLATNARDAMPQGGTLSIATGNRTLDAGYCATHPEVRPGDYALIEISDTGSGMTAEVLSHIFEPFYTTKETGKGTGLGLSMVFGFIKQSEGHINAYSEPGVGTTFRLYLPKRSSADAGVAPREEIVSSSSRGETVLVVEDNEALRRVVLRQLAELGYRTFETTDAAAALALLEQERIDLLFTDIVMPGGLDGFDLARRVLERWPSVKVVLTSGFPSTKINGHLDTKAASARLLSKPYRKDELARVLREVLDGTNA
jgi:two-component system, cell cycle sensor histidine kinase and response regulator CckA